MKKILYIMCTVAAFASCSKESLPTTSGQNLDGSYTFNISIEKPDYAPQTRAIAMGRYMLEMYEGHLTAAPVKMENANGHTGKIVSLDEGRLIWSTEYITTDATSYTDGAVNTAKIFALSTYSATVYPAFAWCAAKNTPATAGINWYIPANNELFALYDVWNGSSSSDKNVVARTAFNEKLSTSGGGPLGDNTYWSSTEYNNDNIRSWYVGFYRRSSGGIEKNLKAYYVRCVSVVSFKQ
ncbi:MAG: DUF1566 domain-containing protein [Oscillospiraceae bacterium]